MEYLKFSMKRFEANDPKARELTKLFLNKQFNIVYTDNPDPFGVDLISKDGFAEVEHRSGFCWLNGEFPWPDINIPVRKAKYFEGSNGIYCVWCFDYSVIGICPFDKIINSPVKENKNRYLGQGEYFFKVLAENFTFYPANLG